VTDNGAASPSTATPQYKKPALELILTTLHAGGKFEAKNYYHSGGLHGVGASVVQALSGKLTRASSATASSGSRRSRAARRRVAQENRRPRAAAARRSLPVPTRRFSPTSAST